MRLSSVRFCRFDGIRYKKLSEVLNLKKIRKKSSSHDQLPELKAFSEGRSFHAWRVLGSHPVFDRDITAGYFFRVWAPNAPKISVIGDFNRWDPKTNPMKQKKNGIWETFIPDVQRFDAYQYAIGQADGSFLCKADPFAFHAATRPNTASKLYPMEHYRWGDAAWLSDRSEDLSHTRPISIYECHLGSWRRTGEGQFLSYRDVTTYLVPYAKEMGFTHVELLPLTEYPRDDSWGYQCTGYFAATSRYGTPDDLKYLIDQLHQAGIGVIMDWVPSHFAKEGFGLRHFDGTPTFEYADPNKGEPPHRDAMIFDFGRREVRSFLFSSAMFWLEEFHLDGLRVDNLSTMLYPEHQDNGQADPKVLNFLQTLNSAIRKAHPDVLLIASDPGGRCSGITTPVNEGGLGFHFRWNTEGMDNLLHYAQTAPSFRPHKHQELTDSLHSAFSDHYILPLSHDRLVHGKSSFLNKLPGDNPMKMAGVRAFYAYMLAHPGHKLLFMGTEFGQWGEWRHEYSLDWHLLQYDVHRKLHRFFKTANNFYLRERALRERSDSLQDFEWLSSNDAEHNILIFLRWEEAGPPLLVVSNFSPVHHKDHRVGVPIGGYWFCGLNSDAAEFGGSGLGDAVAIKTSRVPAHGQIQSLSIDLPPMSTVIYRCTRRNPGRRPKLAGSARDIFPPPKSKAAKSKKVEAPSPADSAETTEDAVSAES